MAEHIYMFSDRPIPVTFRAKHTVVDAVIDWFGRDVKFSNADEETVDARVTVNEQAMLYWAMQYGDHVEVLEPIALRERICAAAQRIREKYNHDCTSREMR